jgi:DNA-binding NarL/FixJ family response regulator
MDRDVKPWLARVLQNFVRSGLRADARRQSREHRSASETADPPPTAEELLSRHEAARLLAGLVSDLSEPQRSILLLHLAEGLTLKEIANQRGVPEGTIRSQFKRAVDDLRARARKHYATGSRDWRLALAPLAQSTQGTAPATALTLKGATLMSLKIKLVTGASAAAALLLLFGAGQQDCARRSVLSARRTAGDGRATNVLAAAPPKGPSTPRLVSVSASTDQELAECEGQLKELLVKDYPRNFHLMRPSTRNQNIIGPIVERVMSRFEPKPSYSLECRVSACRVATLSRDDRAVGAWFGALATDDDLHQKGLSSFWLSRPVKDAVTGARDTMRELYLGVPFRAPSSAQAGHPFDTVGDPPAEAASLASCRSRIAALAPPAFKLTPQEDALVKAASERLEARSRQISREILADLKGTGTVGPGEMTREEKRELFHTVNREQNANGSLPAGRVSDIVRRHKQRLARYWKEALESGLPTERAREILQALREGKIAGVKLRPPILGENEKGEGYFIWWTEEDWQ